MSSLLETINNLDKRFAFAWSLIGLLLAAVLGALSIYTDFIRTAEPKLQVEILGNEPVLDVREKLPDLEVVYQSQDIAKIGKTLSVILVRIANRGSADVLGTFYDPNSPVNVELVGGTLVRAEVTETSNDYLKSAATLTRSYPKVILAPVIFERGEWVTLKLLALHDLSKQPSLSASGKIAGQRDIPIVSATETATETGFFQRTFYGSFTTQLIRIPAYFFAMIFLTLAVVLPTIAFTDWRTDKRRKKLIQRFKRRTRLPLVHEDDQILNAFLHFGTSRFQAIADLVEDDEKLNFEVDVCKDYYDKKEQRLQSNPSERDVNRLIAAEPYEGNPFAAAKVLLDVGVVEKINDKWVIEPDRKLVITAFRDYLDMMGDEPERQKTTKAQPAEV
ncbi:hypothetical protein SAMN03159422_00248 [Agrobacterium fabrum]|uniref:hypothetical protein n=1 Tax=Agrobacterium fabrum TaxID=1176649 RepID=UPI00087F6200|nr:hypothetical protein [Agrobacterium fabrum]SDB14816.1 hypothetical protein SAMN03159422_00248 [Agrobacterium fabrum]SEQ23785.1 hypothetical protein SAMN03159504_00248 [Agrobacterium fabrum]